MKRAPYSPPFEVTERALAACGEIMRLLGRYEGLESPRPAPKLRRTNHIRTVRASLRIEGNTLSEDQITAILEKKRVVGPRREVLEVGNALRVYDDVQTFNPTKEKDLLRAHAMMMKGLADEAGRYRSGGVGILQGSRVAHVAPPPKQVPRLMGDLFAFLAGRKPTHPLVCSAVVHCELEFIHPFSDGNGRMGQLWQHVVLARFHPLFEHVPIESVIQQRQDEYYRVLGQRDREGRSTAFVTFSLDALESGLRELLAELRPERSTAPSRLDRARESFGTGEFSRKDYLAEFATLSTATASRDLRAAVESGELQKHGDKALSRYLFRRKRRARRAPSR